MSVTHIIWDYNGTVLDDAAVSVTAVNEMLRERSLPLTDIDAYRETVALPLEDYYTSLGFQGADMSRLSVEFRSHCGQHPELASIFDDFYDTARNVKALGIKSILLSSLYTPFLMAEVEKYQIAGYFDRITGLNNKSVGSKLDTCKALIIEDGLSPESLLIIGDMVNDARMAKALGAHCVLIPNGHNSRRRCEQEQVAVLDCLSDVIPYIKTLYK